MKHQISDKVIVTYRSRNYGAIVRGCRIEKSPSGFCTYFYTVDLLDDGDAVTGTVEVEDRFVYRHPKWIDLAAQHGAFLRLLSLLTGLKCDAFNISGPAQVFKGRNSKGDEVSITAAQRLSLIKSGIPSLRGAIETLFARTASYLEYFSIECPAQVGSDREAYDALLDELAAAVAQAEYRLGIGAPPAKAPAVEPEDGREQYVQPVVHAVDASVLSVPAEGSVPSVCVPSGPLPVCAVA